MNVFKTTLPTTIIRQPDGSYIMNGKFQIKEEIFNLSVSGEDKEKIKEQFVLKLRQILAKKHNIPFELAKAKIGTEIGSN